MLGAYLSSRHTAAYRRLSLRQPIELTVVTVCCFAALLLCCFAALLLCCFAALLLCCSAALLLCCLAALLLCCFSALLLCCFAALLLCCLAALLLCCFAALLLCCFAALLYVIYSYEYYRCCVQPFSSLPLPRRDSHVVIAGMQQAEIAGGIFNFANNFPNAFMASTPGHPFWMKMLRYLDDPMRNLRNTPEGETGTYVC